jgi:uncharacterized membrane protein
MTSEDTTNQPLPRPGERSAHGDGGFGHSAGRDRGGPLSSTTRYLSGAAYVDQKYAEVVVDEMVGESHRAVAPSLGYDVATVVRHCFQAQRLWLVQNALITAVLLVGLVLRTVPTVVLFLLCLAGWYFLPAAPGMSRRRSTRTVAIVVAALLVLFCLAGPLISLLSALDSGSSGLSSLRTDLGTSPFGDTSSPAGDGSTGKGVGYFVVLALGVLAVLVWSRYRMITTIASELGRGRATGQPRPERQEVEQRLRVIDDAQHGNIVLHSGYEPFVGAGRRVSAWSIATELRPEEETADRSARVPIDPVELVTHLRHRLAALRSRELPSSQQVTGLQLRDQLISSGTSWEGFPLIDERSRLPYSVAAPEAIEAIIRAPQTSARHFLRATVGAPEQAAVAADGRTIMPAEHQSVVGSTYLHVAVEGGLLYMELVATVLGPIQQRYLDIDRYEGKTDRFNLALREAAIRFAFDTTVAPARLARALVRLLSLPNAIRRADSEAAEEPVYDFGARLDVRELAARGDYANYLQRLDAAKYARLIDRRATEAIHEFLLAKGVDTSDFAAKVNFHQYNTTSIGGSAYGPVATGTSASASMTTTAPANGKGKSA